MNCLRAAEREQHRAQAGPFDCEGPAFQASSQGSNGLAPVYRFYNAKVYRPFYRSYVPGNGFHFYSFNASEGAGLAQYRAESVAYYVVGTSAAATPPMDPNPAVDAVCGLPGFQSDLLQQVNAARGRARTCGGVVRAATAPMVWNANLQVAAARHSTDMAKIIFFSHTGSDGSDLGERATAAGHDWRGIGENIAAGPSDIATVMNGWLASEGHCNNTMESSFEDVALACVSQPGTTFGKYWTMGLGRR